MLTSGIFPAQRFDLPVPFPSENGHEEGEKLTKTFCSFVLILHVNARKIQNESGTSHGNILLANRKLNIAIDVLMARIRLNCDAAEPREA